MKKISLLLVLALIVVVACKKEIKVTGPDITINSPTSGEEFHSGDSLLVDVELSDPDMHSYSYSVVNTDTKDTLVAVPETHDHNSDVHIIQKYQLPVVVAHTPLRLTVVAEDHNENGSEKSVDFHIMP